MNQSDLFTWAMLGVFGGGYMINRTRDILQDRRDHELQKNQPPEEVCQCTHAAAFHATDGCSAYMQIQVSETPAMDGEGDFTGEFQRTWETKPCPCLHYVGPNSIPELTMPATHKAIAPKETS